MATVIGLGVQFSANANGMTRGLSQAERSLQSLGKQASDAANLFERFASTSSAAARAQEQVATDIRLLGSAFNAGLISAEDYARELRTITSEAKASAAAFAEGAAITERVTTAEERRASELARLGQLLDAGAISEETYARASAEASGANAEAARAERSRADALASAARIIQANLTPQERYDQQVQELTDHLLAGRLTQEQFNRAQSRARDELERAGQQADRTDASMQRLNRNVSLLAKIEIGRLIFDGLQLLTRSFSSAATQITSFASSVNGTIDKLNDVSARTGIGVEALQQYGLAAKLAGVDTEQFQAAVQKLGVNIGRAAEGDALDRSLRSINLSVQELRALAPEQQFSVIGQAISQLPTAADRAAAAVEIFGKQGAALAPLFREGAASIEELQARAERLGLIVSETQVNNVAEMNDAFDLVRGTIEGIIGLVIGNLAPAVTAVTDEFLKFVEEWSGAQGQGGTGIANAITDTLLSGAEIFAGIFDEFMKSFVGLGDQLEAVGQAFDVAANVFDGLVGVFKSIVNTFEIVGNSVAAALGKVLEAIGSYLSEDLEQFGANLAENASQQLSQNLDQLQQAGEQITQAATNVVFGTPEEQQAAGGGAAVQFIQGLRDRIRQEREPEFQVNTNIEQTRERFDAFFNGIVDSGSAVTDAMREFEAAVAAVVDPLNMTEEEIKRIEQTQSSVNQLISDEQRLRQESIDAAAKQSEEDQKRIDGLLKTSDAATKLDDDLAAVAREQERLQAEIARGRNDQATARLAELDQLQARLEEQQQAIEQGFANGFSEAFNATNRDIGNLIAKAEQFGNVGAAAAQQLQAGIAAAQQQVRDGILTQETYEREVAQQRQIFEERLAGAQRVEDFLRANMDERQRMELDNARQLEERRKQAAQNIAAIEDKLAAERKALEEARDNGDFRAARAVQGRINQLRQVQRAEQQIAEGRIQNDRQAADQFAQRLDSRTSFAQSAFATQTNQFLGSFQRTYAAASNALEASNAAAIEQARKIEQLMRPVQGPASTADIRTAEGAALVLSLTANAQDPQLIQQRLQTKELQGIRQAITNAVTGYLEAPVAILG